MFQVISQERALDTLDYTTLGEQDHLAALIVQGELVLNELGGRSKVQVMDIHHKI